MTHLRIKELAEQQGFNITSLAEAANLTWPTVSGYWHEKNDQYNRRVLDALAFTLGVRVSDLFGGEPTPPENQKPPR